MQTGVDITYFRAGRWPHCHGIAMQNIFNLNNINGCSDKTVIL